MKTRPLLLVVATACSTYGEESAPSIDAGAADAKPIVDANVAPPDAGADATVLPPLSSCAPPGFCENFEGAFPGAWKVTTNGIASQALTTGGPTGKALELEVTGQGNSIVFERTLLAKAAIRCELDVLLSTWSGQADFFGATFDLPQGAFHRWYSYWGTASGVFALLYFVQSSDKAKTWEEYPKSAGATPSGFRHVIFDLELGSQPRFTASFVGVATVSVANPAPTDGSSLMFLVRFGIFDVADTTTRKLTFDNIACQSL